MVDLLALTSELIAMPSESFAEGPFVDWLETELSSLDHLEVDRIGDNLIAHTSLGREQRILLVGHTDTVPANGNAVPRIEGDVLWGLGAADMKGGLAVFLDIARTVTDPVVDLTFVFYAREEVGQVDNGLNEVMAERPDLLAGDCAIVGEPTDATIEAGCQGAMRVEVVLAGARAHTARPWMGRNAVHRMAGILTDLAAYEARTPTIDGCTYRRRCKRCRSRAAWPATWCPTAVRSTSITGSRRIAPRSRPKPSCGNCWPLISTTATPSPWSTSPQRVPRRSTTRSSTA